MNRDNTVRQAGGFIVQLMPFAEEEMISKLEENIKNLSSVTTMLDAGKTGDHRYTSCGICLQLQQGQSEKSTDQHWQRRIAVHDR